MLSLREGNLLDADVEAVVNTVNTVGVMGKGIALMFKERYPRNFAAYARACKSGEVRIGRIFATDTEDLFGPRWILNFPTKNHWRARTRLEWVEQGLEDLVRVIKEKNIRSIAVPPLGCGNGRLDWRDVKPLIIAALEDIDGLDAFVYSPTTEYQNVVKPRGVQKLTPARALMAEMVRRYCLIGIDCSILEVQKLAWFIDRGIRRMGFGNLLRLNFSANKYGPYSHNLTKLLDNLDGSYLRCRKRLADAKPDDFIWFNEEKKDFVKAYLNSMDKPDKRVVEWVSDTIDGFESPYGMELLGTVDWLVEREGTEPTTARILEELHNWLGGEAAGRRKARIFDQRSIDLALDQLRRARLNNTALFGTSC